MSAQMSCFNLFSSTCRASSTKYARKSTRSGVMLEGSSKFIGLARAVASLCLNKNYFFFLENGRLSSVSPLVVRGRLGKKNFFFQRGIILGALTQRPIRRIIMIRKRPIRRRALSKLILTLTTVIKVSDELLYCYQLQL
jgi:hypothetical protein